MNGVSILRGLARNSAWANHRLLGACAQLSGEELVAARTSFFPSILKTLNHIVLVDEYYLDALERGGRGRAIFAAGDEPYPELGPLREAQRALDRRIIARVEAIEADGDLEVEVAIERVDHVQRERTGDVLLHLFQHQIHHRGQVHAMLAGTRVAPPPLDEFFLREELPLRARELEELGLPPE